MPFGQRCSLMNSRQTSSVGKSRSKCLRVYLRCLGMCCFGFAMKRVCQIVYLLSRDNYLAPLLKTKAEVAFERPVKGLSRPFFSVFQGFNRVNFSPVFSFQVSGRQRVARRTPQVPDTNYRSSG